MLATKTIAQGPIAASGSASYRVIAQNATYALSMHGAGKLITDIYPSGFYLINGRAVGLSAQRPANFDTGSFTLSGQDVTLKQGYGVIANNGSYALTGQDFTFGTGYGLISSAGTFSLTGQIANLSVSMNAENAEYFLIIEEAPKKLSKISDSGSFSFVGQGAELTANRNLITQTIVFTVQGRDVNFQGYISPTIPPKVYVEAIVPVAVFNSQVIPTEDIWTEVASS